MRGFDLNTSAPGTSSAPGENSAAGNFIPGPQSEGTVSGINVADQEFEEEILSQPMVPYVGMTFDDIEVAREVYNDMHSKLVLEHILVIQSTAHHGINQKAQF